jgi:DNA-directed RNA polymerase specialized sigma24 family protein/CheY-like chemotaxis protein
VIFAQSERQKTTHPAGNGLCIPVHIAMTKAMSMAAVKEAIIQHLPYLRRYARSLTGSQRIGDEYIKGCLETLLQEPHRVDPNGNPRLQLYKLFHSFAGTIEAATDQVVHLADPISRKVGERLFALAPRTRQALLLVHQEGFSVPEAAEILGMDADQVSHQIDEAWTSLKRQRPTGVLIIEDERIIALEITDIVKSLGHHLCGTAETATKAIAMARQTKPGLVLADIQLQDSSSGIEAVREILKSIDVPVIFVTSFPEQLLTGEALEPAFVITKPFNPATIKVAISQALFFAEANAESAVA